MKKNKGFSLVELIIVIAIMAILVGVIAPQLIRYIEKANISSDVATLDSIRSAITYAISDPAYATSGEDVGASGSFGSSSSDTANKIMTTTVDSGTKFKSKTLKEISATAASVGFTIEDKTNKVAVSVGDFTINKDGEVKAPSGDKE